MKNLLVAGRLVEYIRGLNFWLWFWRSGFIWYWFTLLNLKICFGIREVLLSQNVRIGPIRRNY